MAYSLLKNDSVQVSHTYSKLLFLELNALCHCFQPQLIQNGS